MNHELPTTTEEGEALFEEIFGISFENAKRLAEMEGEIGERYRKLFEFLKHDNQGETHTGTDQTESD